MPPQDAEIGVTEPVTPSMLDLVRLSPRRLFPPGGVELFRHIAVLTDMKEADEVLGVGCGKGVALGYFVEETGVRASGVEYDPHMVELAERWAREQGVAEQLQFQVGPADALPYRDEIFDIALGEIGIAGHCDPEDAVRELVRVTKPGGFVVLVQLVWKAPVDAERRAVLSEHLGARPRMLVEWKRILREAGIQDVHTEDWSDAETSFRAGVVKPFPDFAELFSLSEKVGVLRRAWRRWGWKGVKAVLARESEVHKLLTTERILGLDLLRGRKGAAVGAPTVSPEPEESHTDEVEDALARTESVSSSEVESSSRDGGMPVERSRDAPSSADTAGLPLFTGDQGPEGGTGESER